MKNTNRLANAIASLLQEGILLGDDLMHFMHSVCGIDSPVDLETRLLDPHDSETETLCELLFFPDESQRILLEPIIMEHTFSATDEAELVERLKTAGISSIFVFPGNRRTRPVPVPEFAIEQFVRRLHIRRTIDTRVADSIQARTEDSDMRLTLRVRLRNSRFSFSENAIFFLREFFGRLEPERSDFFDLFTFSCEMLEEIGPDDNIYTALMDRKRLCAEMIRQAKKSERDLKGLPVEALIMKGISITCMGEDEARRQIDMIDRIALAVYGRTEFIERLLDSGDTALDLGDFQAGGKDIHKVIRILS